jgi:hypothetical protein
MYSIEWLIVLPLSGMINFSSSANFTNYGSSNTDFFSGCNRPTLLALSMTDGRTKRNNTVGKECFIFICYLNSNVISNVIKHRFLNTFDIS